jgi:hypothetical protein
VRGPLFLPELRYLPPPGAPLMITSQHPPRIVIQTPKRSWNGRDAGYEALAPIVPNPSALSRFPGLLCGPEADATSDNRADQYSRKANYPPLLELPAPPS